MKEHYTGWETKDNGTSIGGIKNSTSEKAYNYSGSDIKANYRTIQDSEPVVEKITKIDWKLIKKSINSCKKIYEISDRLAEDIDFIERENSFASIVDMLHKNLKEFKNVREHEFQKLTMLFLQAIDYKKIEQIDSKKAKSLRDAFLIYKNPKISKEDVADVRKVLRDGKIDILSPLLGDF